VFPSDGESVEGLLHVAEQALEKARGTGPGHVVAKDKTYAVSPTTGRSRVDVALVDDDALLGPLLLHALEKKGYSTLWIQDGLEAGRRLAAGDATESARVLLLDVDLPGQSGYALLRQLVGAKKLEDTRVLMLTARSNQKDVLTGLELGATDHVTKPFTLPVLLEKVRHALHS
jgi:DNA-binding response OmpR family regulator